MLVYSVYLVRCSDNSLYCGITNDIEERLACHNSGKASKYTRSRLPVRLVCSVTGFTKSEALKLEHKIKRTKSQSKIQVLETYNERTKLRFETSVS
jgi:putative endonuclease